MARRDRVWSGNAKDAGVGERFHVVAGNAFEVEWGGEYDLMILANILHHLGPEACATILRKVKSSLSREGRACASSSSRKKSARGRLCRRCLPS